MVIHAGPGRIFDLDRFRHRRVMAMSTVPVEIDRELLSRLRARHPGLSDRELLEQLAQTELAIAMIRESQRRNAVDEEEALREGVRAVHEARQDPR